MSIANMDKIFNPRNVAVIGASDREGSIGSVILNNLKSSGFQGDIFPVNSNKTQVNGYKAVKSISAIDTKVDLAVIATPIKTVPGIIQECSHAQVGGAIIISAGGKETGEEGRALEMDILEKANHSGLRLIGPNCLGIISSKPGLNASFARYMPQPGRLAFVSQSGAICSSILDFSVKEHIGFSYFVSLGSTLDVDFGDMIDYLGCDPEVSSIVMYIESLTQIRKFMSAARAVSRIKPIIVFKAGRSKAGAKAAASHTGAMTGEDAVYDAAFKRAGILRVKTFEELFDCAELLSRRPRLAGPSLGILTNSGGPGVMAADALNDYQMEPATLSVDTVQKLDAILPAHWSRGNPIDIIGDASSERYCNAVKVLKGATELNGLLIMLAPTALVEPSAVAEGLIDELKSFPMPVFTSWLGGKDVEKGRDIFNRAGIPTFDSPERAIRAFMDLYRFTKNIEMLQEIPSRLPNKLNFFHEKADLLISEKIINNEFVLTEIEASKLLSLYGIPVNKIEFAISLEEAVAKAKGFGFNVVMKICSRDIPHKSDADGVRLNLLNEADVREAYHDIMRAARHYKADAVIDGVTIQPMLGKPDFELILGAKKDQDFGPVILFGMGGVMAEVLQDKALSLPPLNRLLARNLMTDTKIYKLLKGFRNIKPANMMQLEEILIRISQLVTDFPEISEMDINPLTIKDGNACAVDARIILKPSGTKSPAHMVISPYPNGLESHITLKCGEKLFVRPIRPEDASLLTDLFYDLSPQSVYFRFFSPLKQLSHWMLARFTQIDYDREMALVAITESGGTEKMLGVSRIITMPGREKAEFSVVVADKWQGKGIGAALLTKCLQISRERQVYDIYGLVLYENTTMIALSKKLGFKMTRSPDAHAYEMTIDLRQVAPELQIFNGEAV
ncbi:MAG: GNAT family N-acetyltransferase [Proteobacteria bacterium]|nr:GNAT family N-acetyltransferase [Pseudomonadota bacterium]